MPVSTIYVILRKSLKLLAPQFPNIKPAITELFEMMSKEYLVLYSTYNCQVMSVSFFHFPYGAPILPLRLEKTSWFLNFNILEAAGTHK
jgi:hypothetical protein